MRKVLLSTTALVAAGLLVTSVAYAGDEEMAEEEMMMEEEAMADEMAMEEEMAAAVPVSVGIGGYSYVAFGASTADDSPAMYQLFDVNLSGSATMDNGLTFGVSTKLRTGEEHAITVDGAFGSIALGQARSARGGSRIASAGATGMFGVNGPYQAGIGKAVGTNSVSHGSVFDEKIVYTSPSVGGITLAASYAPGGTSTPAVFAIRNAGDCELEDHVTVESLCVEGLAPTTSPTDQISAALTYTQELGDISASVNLGYETASGAGNTSPTDLNAGASLAMGDITVSGGMWDVEGGAMQMDIGASMAMGALSLSVGWGNTDSTDMYAIGASYPLGEGVALDTQLDFGDDGTDQWVQFMIGTGITF